jgi:hypothetical protein
VGHQNAPACCGSCADIPHRPTESATSTSSPPEQQHQQQSTARSSSRSLATPSTSDSYRDDPYSQRPNNAPRQDSAIAQQPFDRSPDSNSNQSHRNANSFYHSASPEYTSYSTSRSSRPSGVDHVNAFPPREHEHVAWPTTPAQPHTGPVASHRRITPPLSSDHPGISNARQSRYNVRFATNHTPSTMPVAQRPRPPSPGPAVSASLSVVDPPSPPQTEQIAREREPALLTIWGTLQPVNDQSQTQGLDREPSVERCSRCNEAWNRPLPKIANWSQDSPAEGANAFAQANMNLLNQIEKYGKDADLKYEQWKERHSHCPRNGYRDRGTSPDQTDSTDSSHSRAVNRRPKASEQAPPASNKRKSEAPHGDNSKVRKVTLDAVVPAAPPVSAPM